MVCPKCPRHLAQIKDLNTKVQEFDKDYRLLWDEKKSVMEDSAKLQSELDDQKARLERREEERQEYYAANEQLVQENSLLQESLSEKCEVDARKSSSGRRVSISPDGARKRRATHSPAPKPGVAAPDDRIRASSPAGPPGGRTSAQRDTWG